MNKRNRPKKWDNPGFQRIATVKVEQDNLLPVSISKPHHTQEHSTSCLPASVKMLLNFIGDTIEEAALRDLLGTTDRGTTIINRRSWF